MQHRGVNMLERGPTYLDPRPASSPYHRGFRDRDGFETTPLRRPSGAAIAKQAAMQFAGARRCEFRGAMAQAKWPSSRSEALAPPSFDPLLIPALRPGGGTGGRARGTVVFSVALRTVRAWNWVDFSVETCLPCTF